MINQYATVLLHGPQTMTVQFCACGPTIWKVNKQTLKQLGLS